jgi:hypothetical protein
MSEISGRHRPSPECERAAVGSGSPKSPTPRNTVCSTCDHSDSPLDLQSRKLVRLFFFRQDTPRTIASLAFAGCTR